MTKHVCVACYNRKLSIFVMFFFLFLCVFTLKGPSKKLPGRIIYFLKKEKVLKVSRLFQDGGRKLYFYQFQQSLIAPAGSLRHPGRTTTTNLKLELRKYVRIHLILNGKILNTSESNEVSLLRNFPFFVNMSKNMSVVDWLVSPAGDACGASKCTCGKSGICENINY